MALTGVLRFRGDGRQETGGREDSFGFLVEGRRPEKGFRYELYK